MNQSNDKSSESKVVAYTIGASIRGEKIAAQFRKIGRITVTHGSSTHNIQRTALEGSVLCVIDRPLNYLRDLPKKSG